MTIFATGETCLAKGAMDESGAEAKLSPKGLKVQERGILEGMNEAMCVTCLPLYTHRKISHKSMHGWRALLLMNYILLAGRTEERSF